MVGGVIKDPGLRPYKLEKEQKCRDKRKRIRFSLSLYLSLFLPRSGERMTKRRLGRRKEREKERIRSGRRVRRQPVTNLTLNQLTCARCTGAQTRARTRCIRVLSRSLARRSRGLLACNMCNIMYAMLRSRIFSRWWRPTYVDPLNKLTRATSPCRRRFACRRRREKERSNG